MSTRDYRRSLHERSASLFLFLLLVSDLLFIFLHFANLKIPVFKSPFLDIILNLEEDRGYAEMFQYLKYCWVVVLLLFITWKKKTWQYSAWVPLFLYFLVDDFFQIHEWVGSIFATQFSFVPPFGLRLEDIGELTASVVAGGVLFIPLVLAYKSGSTVFRKVSHDLALLIFLLVCFAVGVDMVHGAIDMGWKVSFILGVIEDGGELLSMSLIVWYIFLQAVRVDSDGGYLCDRVYRVFR
ncbi:MAG: hypothetical protein GXY53_04590 [Desulfobulbus sp.]|nr:hypothetical protein [Desulfobulbus sp.]